MKFASANDHFPTMQHMTERAYEALSVIDFGGRIDYASLTTVCGDDAQRTRTRAAILRAAQRLLRDHSKLLRNVRGFGYEIVQPTMHASESQRLRGFARRRLRKALASVTFVRLENMTAEDVNKILTEQTRNAILIGMDRKLGRKALPPRQQIALPSGKNIVEMFTKKAG